MRRISGSVRPNLRWYHAVNPHTARELRRVLKNPQNVTSALCQLTRFGLELQAVDRAALISTSVHLPLSERNPWDAKAQVEIGNRD